MADWMGSISRGFTAGNEIGDTLAARGLRKRAADAERRLVAGEINEDQYEQELRDAQSRGFARMRDVSTEAEGLRTRGLDVLNRRDDRTSARAMVNGQPREAWQALGNRVTRTGDVAGALTVRQGLNRLDAAGRVTRTGGVTNYAPAMAAQEQQSLELGDLTAAQEAGTAARTQMDVWAGRVFSDALNTYQSGDPGTGLAQVNSVVQELGLPFHFQLDNANGEDGAPAIAMVPNGEGGTPLIMGEREFFQQLGGIADGSNTLKNVLARITSQDEARVSRESDLTKRSEDAVFEILTQSGGNPGAAGQLLSATQRARAAGVQTIATQDDGSMLLRVGDNMVVARPPAPGEGKEPGQTNWAFVDARSGQPTEVDGGVASAVQEFAVAERLAFEQGQYQISAEDRNARIAQIMQFTHSQLGRPGMSPAAAGMLREAAAVPMEDMDAIDQFFGAVGKLEGTAPNSESSAVGPGQFTNGTMLSIARKYFPTVVDGMDDKEILALRTTDPEFMDEMIRAYATDNAQVFRSAQVPVNPVTLYLGHHFGAQRATRLYQNLQTDPNMPVGKAFSPTELRRNPYLADPERNPSGTLAGVLGDWQRRQPELFASMTGADVDQLTARPRTQPPQGADEAAGGQTKPPAAQVPATMPEAERLATLRARMAEVEDVIRLGTEASAPIRNAPPPQAGLGSAVYVPFRISEESPLTAEDRAALQRAVRERDTLKAEIQKAELDVRTAENRARLNASLDAFRQSAGLQPRTPTGARE